MTRYKIFSKYTLRQRKHQIFLPLHSCQCPFRPTVGVQLAVLAASRHPEMRALVAAGKNYSTRFSNISAVIFSTACQAGSLAGGNGAISFQCVLKSPQKIAESRLLHYYPLRNQGKSDKWLYVRSLFCSKLK